MGFAEKARMLTRPPAPPRRQKELAEHVEMRQAKIRRLEARGDEFKLAPAFKIDALRMLTTGKAKEHFDLSQADRDASGQAKSYEELLTKIKNSKKEKVGQFSEGEDARRR